MAAPALARPAAGPLAGTVAYPPAVAADGTVSGRITDAKGQGLPGVTVLIEGTTLGSSTNADGSFVLQNVPAGPHTLVISFIGFTTERRPITVGAQPVTVNVALAENATALTEAVVVGYGTTRRQDVTGSIATVSTKDFVKGQVTSPEQLVQGKLAGVQITNGGGAPGEVNTIRIRGGSSLNASNDPLIVIDGVPVDNNGINGAGSPLSLVNPNDIESFTVLKDASATAIYGSRASNGVILITTKKGVTGEATHVNVSSQLSRATNYKNINVLDGPAYRDLLTQAIAAGTVPASNAQYLGPTNTNWQDAIYQSAWTSDNNVSVTGSTKNMPYRVSIGYLEQQGTLKTSNLSRNSASIGLSPQLFDNHLRINLNLKGTWADYRFADQNAIGGAVRFNPTQPIYDPTSPYDGYFEWQQGPTPNSLTDRNPLGLLTEKRDRSTVKRSIGNIQFDYKLHFFPDLHINVNLGYDVSRSQGSIFIPASSAVKYTVKGENSQYKQEKDNKLFESYLNYTKQFGDHRVEAVAGYSFQDFYTYSPFFFTPTADGTLLNPNTVPSNPYKTQYTLLSYYGRVNYSFKDRYLFTGTLRNDRSSHFSPGTRSGIFPAASVAWRINQENFLASSAFISNLKVRGSFGITGQQDITKVAGDYPYLALYRVSTGTVRQIFGRDTITTLRPGGYDSNLKWEQTKTYDAGLDFGFFSNRLTGSLDVYLRQTKDLLAVIPLPAGSNLTNVLLTNVGNLENKGIELSLNYDLVRGERLNWSVNFNATMNRGKITKLSQVDDPNSPGTPVGNIGNFQFVQTNSVGHAPNTFYLYQQKYENGRPLQSPTPTYSPAQYVDQNNDGIINERDKVYSGNPAPKAFLGFSSNVSYAKFSLAFTMRANLGGIVYNGVDAGQGNYYGLNTGLGYSANVVPNIYASGFTTGEQLSNFYLHSASFARLQNVTVGYDLGGLFKGVQNLRLTLAGQNLLVITKYNGLDPEHDNGIDGQFYPRPRAVTLGVNATF